MGLGRLLYETTAKELPSAEKMAAAILKVDKSKLGSVGDWISANKSGYTDLQLARMRKAFRQRVRGSDAKAAALKEMRGPEETKLTQGIVDSAHSTTEGAQRSRLPMQLPLSHEPSVKASEFKTTGSTPEKTFRYKHEMEKRGLVWSDKTKTLTHPKMHAAIKQLKKMPLTEVRKNPHFIKAHKQDPKLTPLVFRGDRIQELQDRINKVKRNFYAAARASQSTKETKHLAALDEKAGKLHESE